MKVSEIFNRGQSFGEFIRNDGEAYAEEISEILGNIKVDTVDSEKAKSIGTEIKVLACAEVWCPDSRASIPVLEKLKSLSSKVDFSIVGKEGNEEFFKQYTHDGVVRIPMFLICDNDFSVRGTFIEMPEKLKSVINNEGEPEKEKELERFRKGFYGNEVIKEILKTVL